MNAGDDPEKLPKVVVIGGGTGSFNLLRTFKNENWDLTALVNMADNGGSTGVLRDELGVLPPGDVRQCLVALSQSPKMRDLFAYRFDAGGLKGHSFGNLFLSTAQKMTDNFSQAVELASAVLAISGQVLPITTDDVQLAVRLASGQVINGESQIAQANFDGASRQAQFWLEPSAKLSPAAGRAIGEADLIVIAPGNLYASLAPALIVSGVGQALAETAAKIVYVCNLVNKSGQSDGFMVHDYAAEIERFIGQPVIDYVIYNTETPPPETLQKYVHEGEFLVGVDETALASAGFQAIGRPLIAGGAAQHQTQDALAAQRSLIRHNATALARRINQLL
ncbi:MAG: gluconeogenesis factor YvcK family protein [Candidatus Saccharimonadales bacterium]